jgi:hypothetical protein
LAPSQSYWPRRIEAVTTALLSRVDGKLGTRETPGATKPVEADGFYPHRIGFRGLEPSAAARRLPAPHATALCQRIGPQIERLPVGEANLEMRLGIHDRRDQTNIEIMANAYER